MGSLLFSTRACLASVRDTPVICTTVSTASEFPLKRLGALELETAGALVAAPRGFCQLSSWWSSFFEDVPRTVFAGGKCSRFASLRRRNSARRAADSSPCRSLHDLGSSHRRSVRKPEQGSVDPIALKQWRLVQSLLLKQPAGVPSYSQQSHPPKF